MEKPLTNNQCAVLVLSCDKYANLWRPFFLQYDKFWPDNPFKTYLGTNTVDFKGNNNVTVIFSGKYKDWSSNLLAILNKMQEEYIFIWLEDLFLIDKARTGLFKECFNYLYSNKANHIHLNSIINPDKICTNNLFGLYEKRMPYRVSAVGFWRKSHLIKILLPGENPWQFEIYGSYRSSFYNGYYCFRKKLFSYIQIVERGKIFREARDYCFKNNIALNLEGWNVTTLWDYFLSNFNRMVFHLIIKFPWKLRLNIIDLFRKILASY